MKMILAADDEMQVSIDGLDGTWHVEAGTNSYGAMLAIRRGPDVVYAMIFRPVDYMLRGNGFFFAEKKEGVWEWCECPECGDGKYRRLHAATVDPDNPRRLVVLLEGSSKRFWTTSIKNIGATTTTRPSLSSSIAITTLVRGSVEGRVLITTGHQPSGCMADQTLRRRKRLHRNRP